MAKRNREKVYGDFEYILPVQPPKKDIFFSDLPRKKQKWVRTPMPDDFDSWDISKQIEYTELLKQTHNRFIEIYGKMY